MNPNQVLCDAIVEELHQCADSEVVNGMSRFGIQTSNALGVKVPVMRDLSKRYRKNHELAELLWQTNIHEARHVASMIDDPQLVTDEQMDRWVLDFNTWDICDGVIFNLFGIIPLGWKKVNDWVCCEEEYVRRAAFTIIAKQAMYEKKTSDKNFLPYFKLIIQYSTDERNFVKKAVNWALRQLGKRSHFLRLKALKTCDVLLNTTSPSARWIASDARRELMNEKIINRIKR